VGDMPKCNHPLGVGVDLVVIGVADAEGLSGSRWHMMDNVAREGQLQCCL